MGSAENRNKSKPEGQAEPQNSVAKMGSSFKAAEEKWPGEANTMKNFRSIWSRLEHQVESAELMPQSDRYERAVYARHIYNTINDLSKKAESDNNTKAYPMLSKLTTAATELFWMNYFRTENLDVKILSLEPLMISCGELCGVKVLTFKETLKNITEYWTSHEEMRLTKLFKLDE